MSLVTILIIILIVLLLSAVLGRSYLPFDSNLAVIVLIIVIVIVFAYGGLHR